MGKALLRAGLSVVLTSLAAPAAWAQNPPVTIAVDADANVRPIDPRIYGVNYGSPSGLAELNAPLNRQGGTPTTRYNWLANADNRGDDYFFESLRVASGSATAGEWVDSFITSTKAAGSEPMITIPTIGWIAKLGPGGSPLCSFSVATYGAQECVDPFRPDCGNGRLPTGCACGDCPSQPLVGNDPNDASVLVDSNFQRDLVQHIVGAFGPASAGGLKYYMLDQEYGIWYSSHRDVSPEGPTMDEVRDKIIDYGTKVRTTDPSATIIGPDEWNFEGYIYSGYDNRRRGLGLCDSDDCPDRAAHGGADYLPYVLDQLRQNEVATGQRILDVFAVHYYPEGDVFNDDISPPTQLKRNRSTRSLWDPAYVDESYLDQVLRVIPRLREWVATFYPGTQVGILEYSWGAENHINGATTQADVLGILGREGVDMAARWEMPDPATPTYKAFRMYRNYDGALSTFGNLSVAASVPNPDQVSAFAAKRTGDGALTIMAISKHLTGNTSLTVNLSDFAHAGTAAVWRLTAANTIDPLPDITFGGSGFTTTVPAQSITLFVLPPGSGLPALSISDPVVAEGEDGATDAVFTVSLSAPHSQTVTVAHATADGSATVGSDYVVTNGSLTFPPGTTSRTVPVPVFGDRVFEGDETFTMTLSGATQATIADGQGTAEITDDDAAGLSVANVRANEGGLARFTVTLSPPNPIATVTVSYFTFDGTALSSVDYQFATGIATFPPGATTQAVDVPVLTDAALEPTPETFHFRLQDPVGAGIAYDEAIASINDQWRGWDFNGDTRTDILWRHDVSGQNVLWYMNGATLLNGTFLNPPTLPDTNWKMVGTSDFNQDGKPDILWRHAVSGQNVAWYMNGANLVDGAFLNPPALPDVNWGMVGTGDFNGDGKPDILWRHAVSGENVVWYMNGITLITGGFTGPRALVDTNWRMSGVGDFDGDGKPDILWRHGVSGQNVIWFMDGVNLRSGTFTTPPTLPDTSWTISAVGDYNQDGKPDILWRHQVSGQIVLWYMDGAVLTSGTFTNPSSLPDVNWKIVGPR